MRIGNVAGAFHEILVELANSFDENANDDSLGLTHVPMGYGTWLNLDIITTKQYQNILKVVLNKITVKDCYVMLRHL